MVVDMITRWVFKVEVITTNIGVYYHLYLDVICNVASSTAFGIELHYKMRTNYVVFLQGKQTESFQPHKNCKLNRYLLRFH